LFWVHENEMQTRMTNPWDYIARDSRYVAAFSIARSEYRALVADVVRS
jgi:hypothetical protein